MLRELLSAPLKLFGKSTRIGQPKANVVESKLIKIEKIKVYVARKHGLHSSFEDTC